MKISLLTVSLCMAALSFGAGTAFASQPTLNISGNGAAPQAKIQLLIKPGIALSAQSDRMGNFSFSPIPYDFQSPLALSFDLPVQGETRTETKTNTLSLSVLPNSYQVRLQGRVSKAASVALGSNSNASAAGIANQDGLFKLYSSMFGEMKPEKTSILVSVINVEEKCCPRAMIPGSPLTVRLSGIPAKTPVPALSSGTALPSVTSATPADTAPQSQPVRKTHGWKGPGQSVKEAPAAPATEEPKKSPAVKPLFLPSGHTKEFSYGEGTRTAQMETVIRSAGSVNATWVDGLKKVAAQITSAIMLNGQMIGGFIDAQTHLRAQLALQSLAAEANNNYVPSASVCKFGSTAKALAASEGKSRAAKLAINEALTDQETLRAMTAYGIKSEGGDFARMAQFKATFCNNYNEANGLIHFCKATAISTHFNRDVDFTRTLDVPMTLPMNFVSTPTAAQNRTNANVLALGRNLIGSEPFRSFGKDDFQASKFKDDDLQNMRSVVAARSIARNSFSTFAGMKAEGTTNSATYLQAVGNSLGFSSTDVTRLIGSNPSYFAQMEVLTKKIYQDPAFFVNLYETPTNVERQRAAMKGISLQQQADLLETMKRREMLLSVLLELKLRNYDEENAQ